VAYWQDLTEELRDAPHTEKVFERMEIVGVLLTDKMD
jgi:predicted heme/steroid binding protein